MPKLPLDRFLDVLDRSGLLKQDQVESALTALKAENNGQDIADSQVLADRLVQQRLLTRWQANKLMEGRHKGFFLGKYRLLDHLGTGGMSAVYLAEHMVMERRVAIKVLPENKVNDSSYLPRFHREARAAAALDHPNIVRAYDVDNDGPNHYLVMEYVEGRNLQEIVAKEGPLPFETAVEYIRQTADGLAHAHAAGLIHRDIKPANLLVDMRRTVKVLDMGLARFEDDARASLTIAYDENVLGTADYLSPEQAIASHDADGRADIYSLGCTLYFLLTGHPPFPTGSLAQRIAMHQFKDPEPISKDRPDTPADLLQICQRMMVKDRSKRFQSAAEVRDVLEQWQLARRGQVASAMPQFLGAAQAIGLPRGTLLSFGPGASSIDARQMADASNGGGPMTPPLQPRTSPNDTATGQNQDTIKSGGEELNLLPDELDSGKNVLKSSERRPSGGSSKVLPVAERLDSSSASKKGDSLKGGSSIKNKTPAPGSTPPTGTSSISRKSPGVSPSGEPSKIQLVPLNPSVSLAGKLPASSGALPVLNLPGQGGDADQNSKLTLGLIIGGAVAATLVIVGLIVWVAVG